MIEDPDFDMEVVEDDELDEMGADGASSSEKHTRTEMKEEELSEAATPVADQEGAVREGHDGSTGVTSAGVDLVALTPDTDWERQSLNDLCRIQAGFSWNKDQEVEQEEGDIPVLKIGNVRDGYFDLEEVTYLEGVDDSDIEKYKAREGWIVMIGSNGSGERVGHCGIIDRDMEFVYASFLHGLGVKSDQIVPRLLYYFLNKEGVQRKLTSFTAGSTSLKNLNKSLVENLRVPVPPLPEQRKIASVLYAVDQAIQKTEAILEKHRLLRRNYIDEVTTSGYCQHSEKQNIRVGPRKLEIPAMWESVKLGNVTSLITKGQTPTSHGFEYQEDGINFVKAESIDEDGRLNENKFAHIGLEADEKLSRSRLRDGDVLFSIAGALGKVAQIEEQSLPANINQALALIRCDDERVDSRFVRYYLESRTIRKYIQSISTVTAQPNLSLKQVAEFDLFLPPLEEQLEIAQACEHFDRGIINEEDQLRRLHKIKKGLMQDLLTGEVRTTGKAIEVLGEVAAHG